MEEVLPLTRRHHSERCYVCQNKVIESQREMDNLWIHECFHSSK